MATPQTKLHCTPNGNLSGSTHMRRTDGFDLADEPGPDVSAANLKAESD